MEIASSFSTTNPEHKFDLSSPKGYGQMLKFKQLRRDLASDESRNDQAVYSPIVGLSEDWASYDAAKQLISLPQMRLNLVILTTPLEDPSTL